jgi:hypothetical protein
MTEERIIRERVHVPERVVRERILSPENKGDDWLPFVSKSIAKGVGDTFDLGKKAVGALGDWANEMGAPGKLAKNQARKDIDYTKYIPSTEDLPEEYKQYIKPNAGNDSVKKIVGYGLEFAGSAGPWGTLAKSGKIINMSKQALLGGAVGGASGVAQEFGADPLAADIVSSFAVPTTAKIPALTARSLGLTGKNFNLQTAQHAKDIGVELPAAVLTNNGVGRMVEEYLSKAPIIGKQIKNKYKKAGEQTQNIIEDILNKTGPQRTPEWEKVNTALYQKAKNIPNTAVVHPLDTLNAISGIKSQSPLKSPELRSLLKDVNIMKKALATNKPVPISTLVELKQELNNIIKWDTPPNIRDRLKEIRSGVLKDIERYKSVDPEWYSAFREADEHFMRMAKRAKAEKALVTSRTNYATGEVNQNSLAKVINHPDSAALLKKNLNPIEFERLQKLGDISRSLSQRSKDILNPSGTTTTAATNLGLLYGAYAHPLTTAASVGAGLGVKNMLTNQKWIDEAIKYANNPSIAKKLSINDLAKQMSINSAIGINRNEMQRKQQEKRELPLITGTKPNMYYEK